MTKIYLIDDSFNRHLQHTALLDDLKDQGFCGDVCENEEQAVQRASECQDHEKIWSLITSADAESIFLVDFDLRLDSQQIAASNTYFQAMLAVWDQKEIANAAATRIRELQKQIHLDPKYYVAIYTLAVLEQRKIPAIIVSSAAYEVAQHVEDAWKFPMASSGKADAWKGWKREILKIFRHSDPFLRKVLSTYESPVVDDDAAWTHNWFASHRQECAQFIEEETKCLLSIDDCKGLFERALGSWSFESADCRVSKQSLELMLTAVGVNADVKCDFFNFPVSPGLAFLIALKELLQSCGENLPDSVGFNSLANDAGYPEVNWVQIQLSGDSCGLSGFEPVCRFLTKIGEAQSDATAPNGGLCEAVWNLGHCRSSGIRSRKDAWAEMFEKGSQHWVAWPSFAPYSITFHWRRPQARAK